MNNRFAALQHTGKAMIAALICLVFLVSACSGGGSRQNQAGAPQGNASPPQQEQENGGNEESGGAFPRTITDAQGKVTIEKKPEKVAVVHWGYNDAILIFDVPSVALALPFTYKQSVLHTETYKLYVDKIKDLEIVGENTEVNLEQLLAYEPDLIIAGGTLNQEIGEQLSAIATTVFIDETKDDVWTNWPAVIAKIGEILGQEERAAEYIGQFNEQILTAKEKLSGVNGTVAFVQVREKAVYLQGTNYLGRYYDELGLTAPEDPVMAEGAEMSLEGLYQLNPDHLFLGYFNYTDESLPALTDEWEKGSVWGSLNSVKNGHVYPINGELALGYGPIGQSYGIQAIVEALQ
ncbi:ABC transporter substrate-binding protein [Paenibacillus sp. M1]|uniref:ABC transporter substrate-binding protein n=1 Tax=Paenibacillus haidiansis TaxID=1574488 RepID=A0ABU7VKD4_9BACL